MADGDHARLQRGTPNNMIVYWWCRTFRCWIIVVGFLARKNIVVGPDRCRWLLRATNGVFEEMRRGHTDGNGRAAISPACFYLAFMTSAKSHENVTFIKCFGLFRAGHIWAAGVNLSLCCTKLLGHVVLNFLVSCWGPCPGIWLDISKFLLPRWITHFPAGSTFLLLAFVVNSWKGFATCRRYVLDTWLKMVDKFGFQKRGPLCGTGI